MYGPGARQPQGGQGGEGEKDKRVTVLQSTTLLTGSSTLWLPENSEGGKGQVKNQDLEQGGGEHRTFVLGGIEKGQIRRVGPEDNTKSIILAFPFETWKISSRKEGGGELVHWRARGGEENCDCWAPSGVASGRLSHWEGRWVQEIGRVHYNRDAQGNQKGGGQRKVRTRRG